MMRSLRCGEVEKVKYILTGSTFLRKKSGESKVRRTGTGRIALIRMHPMSLFESGDSSGKVSPSEMLVGEIDEGYVRKVGLDEIVRLIIHGG
ncbi:MAG: hypothetical protein IJ801_09500 [Lachnospiraceae bacterium]|nr:hypothetical protein [Clostridia bacterium]MBR1866728.1 hypothetical protein [Lachnospiraceae bacterium]